MAFSNKGYIVVEKNQVDEDALMETAIDAGAEDVREEDDQYEIITEPQDFDPVKEAIDTASIPFIVAETTMLPQSGDGGGIPHHDPDPGGGGGRPPEAPGRGRLE